MRGNLLARLGGLILVLLCAWGVGRAATTDYRINYDVGASAITSWDSSADGGTTYTLGVPAPAGAIAVGAGDEYGATAVYTGGAADMTRYTGIIGLTMANAGSFTVGGTTDGAASANRVLMRINNVNMSNAGAVLNITGQGNLQVRNSTLSAGTINNNYRFATQNAGSVFTIGGGIFNNIGNARLTIAASTTMNVAGGTIDNAGAGSNGIVNQGTVNFAAGATYTGAGVFDNYTAAGAILNIDSGMTGFDDLAASVVANAAANIGNVHITNAVASGNIDAFDTAQLGTLTFDAASGGGGSLDVDVGAADLVFAAANNTLRDVSGGNIAFSAAGNAVRDVEAGGGTGAVTVGTGGGVTFTRDVSAASIVGDGSKTFSANAAYTGALAVGTGGVAVNGNNAEVTVTGALDGGAAGAVAVSNGTFRIAGGTTIAGNAAAYAVSGGEMIVNANANIANVLDNTTLSNNAVLILTTDDPSRSFDSNFALAAAATNSIEFQNVGVGGIANVGNAEVLIMSGVVDLTGAGGIVTGNATNGAFFVETGATLRTSGQNTVTVGGGGQMYINGTLAFADANSKITFGDGTANAFVGFDPNSTISVVAGPAAAGTPGDISKVNIANNGRYDFAGAPVNVDVTGSEADALGKTFLQIADTDLVQVDVTNGRVVGGENLFNVNYTISEFGQILGVKPKSDGITQLTGVPLSANRLALAAYMDIQSGYAKTVVNNYMNLVGVVAFGNPDRARIATDQAGLEYVATTYFEPLMGINRATANVLDNNFLGILRESRRLADAGGSSVDALASMRGCNSCVEESYSTAWASYLGAWDKQRSKDMVAGYKLDGNGIAVGLNHHMGRLTFGAFGAYMQADTKVENLAAKFKSDLMNLGLFVNYLHESGVYARAGYTYGRGWNKYNVDMVVGGIKSGDFGTDSHSLDAELGYVWRATESVNLIPSAGIRYTRYSADSWTETVSGNPYLFANYVNKYDDTGVDVPLRLAVNTTIRTDGFDLIPEARIGWTYAANQVDPRIAGGMAGGAGYYTMRGITPGSNRFAAGLGLAARFSETVDAGINYDYERASKFSSHSLNAGVGFNF